ncbi:MAG: DUF1592 domain-containing protein [Gemmataceae bacterium]|nr:DUF1592 domain-containing protein [Gemmataceae bacterium]
MNYPAITSLLLRRLVPALALTCGFILFAQAEQPVIPLANTANPFISSMKKTCGQCHGIEKPKGGFHLANLTNDFSHAKNQAIWKKVREHLHAGTMPPKGKPRWTDSAGMIAWIDQQTSRRDSKQGRTVLRRLNRIEYQNTLRDLLGIELDLQDLLPPDASAGGFDNVGEALHTSSFLMERYLEAADKALALAIANGPRPPLVKKRYSLLETHQVKVTTEKVFRKSAEEVVCFASSAWQAVSLTPFYPPDRGNYRFRISTSAFQSEKPVTFRVDAGLMLMTGKQHLVGYFDALPGQSRVVEFTDYFEPRNTIRLLPYGLASAQAVSKTGAEEYTGPGLAVQWIDVEGPLHETWPPASHGQLMGDLAQATVPAPGNRGRVEVISPNPAADTARLLRNFARKAFRRNVAEKEIQPFEQLARLKRDEGASFEQALRAGFKAILVSPDFLFLREKPGPLDDFSLATRLSYFLWSSMPDEELLHLAEQEKLQQPGQLAQQVNRMLKNSKADAFCKNFMGQWLGLREIDATAPSHIFYPEYDEMLKASMLEETHRFFMEVLQKDLSLLTFIDADFTFLNGRLARHYGIAGVDGWEMKKTTLPPGSHRGGVLTMASVLKVTANGTYTSPVLRGAWVLDRILGTPPPPPPEGVSAIEPDIRGATTIRDQLARHRQEESCAACHVKIDPPGFALENFDAIGGWREYYRASGKGKPVMLEGRRMHYLQGPPVDAGDVFKGQKFHNIEDFKKLLLLEKDQIVRGMAARLLTYATGATSSPSDQGSLNAIVEKNREQKFGFQSLIREVVNSELFRKN